MRNSLTDILLAPSSWVLDSEETSMPPKPVDKDKKRREIAAAAMSVFAERGFEATSVREVAEKAGIGKGTIYEYFSSKEEIIAASVQMWMESMIEEVESIVVRIQEPEQKLITYVNTMVDSFLSDDRIPSLILSILQFFLMRLHDSAIGEVLQRMFLAGVDSISGILVEGMERGDFRIAGYREAEIIAINLAAFLDGICIDYLVMGRSFDLREQVDHYLRYLLDQDIK
jgi:AcrR family transcriptional regulator